MLRVAKRVLIKDVAISLDLVRSQVKAVQDLEALEISAPLDLFFTRVTHREGGLDIELGPEPLEQPLLPPDLGNPLEVSVSGNPFTRSLGGAIRFRW